MLTASRLRKLLIYKPATGEFIWRINRTGRGGCYAGTRAGTLNGNQHWQIGIDRHLYVAARLAVLWMTGKWPTRLVDHIDCNSSDDRWSNLREANHSQNGANSRPQKRKRVPFKGVRWSKQHENYVVGIKVNYRTITLGHFDDPAEAHAAYVAAARKYFGEFARAK